MRAPGIYRDSPTFHGCRNERGREGRPRGTRGRGARCQVPESRRDQVPDLGCARRRRGRARCVYVRPSRLLRDPVSTWTAPRADACIYIICSVIRTHLVYDRHDTLDAEDRQHGYVIAVDNS